jgi:predicted permease
MPLIPDDVRIAARRLLKHRGASAASVLALALGIAGAATTWSLLSAVLLHPVAVRDADRLVLIEHQYRIGSRVSNSPSLLYPTYVAIRDSGVFEAIAGMDRPRLRPVAARDEAPSLRQVGFVSHDYFSSLGVSLAQGSGFRPDQDRRGAEVVAIVSDAFWRGAFNGGPVIGRPLHVGNATATIVGVAPREFRGVNLDTPPDVYLPLETIEAVDSVASPAYFSPLLAPGAEGRSPVAWIRVVGRLKPGARHDDVIARLKALDRAFGRDTFLTPINTAAVPELARAGVNRFAALIVATVVLLLLTGCITVGMLLLVRTEDRRDEFAVLLALGASRLRLARCVAIEGALMSLAAAAVAVPLAAWLVALAGTYQLPGAVDLATLDLRLDVATWAASAGAALIATGVTAFAAAILALAATSGCALHVRGGTPRITRRRTRAALVAAQVAITLTLTAETGLFARSLIAALQTNPGVDVAHIVTGTISLSGYGYEPQDQGPFFDQLRARLRTSRNVRSVSIARSNGSMGAGGRVPIDGVPRDMPSENAELVVDDQYFRTFGLLVTRGRDFSTGDRAAAAPVMIVSQSLAAFIAPDGNAVGHRVSDDSGRVRASNEVIGIVPDLITRVTDTSPLVRYRPANRTASAGNAIIVMRTTDDPSAAIHDLQQALRAIDARVPGGTWRTLEEQLLRQMYPQRFGTFVLGSFGAVSLLLASLGAYVLASSMAASRRREMTIRSVLGASRASLGSLILRETITLAGAGVVAGLLLTAAGANTIRGLLFRVEPFDAPTLLSAIAVVATVSVLVTLRPALRVSRTNAAQVLREE